MAHNHTTSHATGDGPGYELRDANPRSLLVFGGVLIAFLTLLLFGMLSLYKIFVDEKEPAEAVGARAPGDIYDVLHTLRRSEAERLSSYGWVDRKEGVVRIPIERAIDLVAERGVPHGKGPKSETEMNSHAGMQAEEADAQPKAKDAAEAAKDGKK